MRGCTLKIKLKKKILHLISLSNIGGVQRSFKLYFLYALKKSIFQHFIYGMHELNVSFFDLKDFYKNIQNSIINKIKFVFFLFSKNYIIHFYNNLGSHQVNRLLKIVPCSNIIFHERGTAWNAKDKDIKTFQNNAMRAKVIIANSNASKSMLIKRFHIEPSKIKVLHNGFLSKDSNFIKQNISRYSEKLSVGFIGRFEFFKGAHSVINSAKMMPEYDFFIAGKGVMEEKLKILGKSYKNINFMGSVKEPLEFISKMDIIVVPSIREPLGNVIIESGYCKKPVIASNVDGIPEIIKDNYSGILIDPDQKLSIDELKDDSLLFPQVTINPKTQLLQKPKELDPKKICKAIKYLASNKDIRDFYGNNLNKEVKKNFNIENYYKQMEDIYQSFE